MKIALILISLVACTCAFADKVPDLIRGRYRDEKRFVEARNFAAFQTLVADSYVWVQPDGKTKNRKDAMAEFAPMFKAKSIKMSIKIKRIAKHDETYDANYENNVTMVVEGQGKVHFHEIGTDTWKKIGRKWLIVKTVDTLSEQK